MPKTQDPFITVQQPGSATVIRKGSKYADKFDKRRSEAAGNYAKLDAKTAASGRQTLSTDYPAQNASINRRAASNVAADFIGKELKSADERSKYAK